MKVSIITPCYNSAPYIESTIISVQQQTLSDWEMIIVDDGSTDDSANIVTQISQVDNRIKLIQKENGGSASARNLGLSLAQGEYIQFLDADDTIHREKLEKQTKVMDQGLDVSYTDFSISDSEPLSQPIIKSRHFNLHKLLVGWGVFGTIPLHAFLYKRSFLEKNNITNTSEVKEREDWDFHIKVFSAQPKIKHLKGFCGADYFQCPTGKASNGSLTKLKIGTLKYLLYKTKRTTGYHRFLLSIRTSIELVEIFIHKIRKKISTEAINPMLIAKENLSTILLSCLFLPLAILIYGYRIIWVKTSTENRHKS